MKIFRTIFIMQSYFNGFDKSNSYFVSPKVNPASHDPILQLIEKAQDIIRDESILIKYIANEDFFEKIVDPIVLGIKNENDTGELFSRALKLLQLDPRTNGTGTVPIKNLNKSKNSEQKQNVKETITEEGMKIGQYVQYNFQKLFEDGLISQDEIIKLQQKEYSKKTFNQDFEILRSSDKGVIGDDGRSRYYARELFCGEYLLTSQWFERHRVPFKEWIDKLQIKFP